MNHRIIKLEEMAMNAQPSYHSLFLNGWIVRFNYGHTKRGNSVHPLYWGSGNTYALLLFVEKWYKQRSLPAVFKMTKASLPSHLDTLLEKKGYERIDETSVQTLDLKEFKPQLLDFNISTSSTITKEWLESYRLLNGIDENRYSIIQEMLLQLSLPTKFILLKNKEIPMACGLAVIQEEYVGLFDITTHSSYRRRGYAKEILHHLLDWGKQNGASQAYLQVMKSNEAALTLYKKIGFRECYTYWYRIKDV